MDWYFLINPNLEVEILKNWCKKLISPVEIGKLKILTFN